MPMRCGPDWSRGWESSSVALVSDAGTPLISDPGFKLVRDARMAGRNIVTVPGPCAAIAGLTLAGLPTDRFLFMGFLPTKAMARDEVLTEIANIRATLVFYESGPRLGATLAALAARLGDREAAVARELTKAFEECVAGSLAELAARYGDAPPKGEIVVLVAPPGESTVVIDSDAALREAMARLSLGKAASEVAEATGLDRRTLYARALELKGVA